MRLTWLTRTSRSFSRPFAARPSSSSSGVLHHRNIERRVGQFPGRQLVVVPVLAGSVRPAWRDEIKKLRRGEHCCQDFDHGFLKVVALGTDLCEQGQFLIDFRISGMASPGTRHEIRQHLPRVGRLVSLVRTVDENPRVRVRRPLFVDGCDDLDMVNLDVALGG